MKFRLTYRGVLPSNGNVVQKHEIRRYLHPQLKNLWMQPPLNDLSSVLTQPIEPGRTPLVRQLQAFRFAPLVCEGLRLHAEIDVLMLRPEPPGQLILNGGDIDNRLKTLFDAMRCPKCVDELPQNIVPAQDETPFHCLLEDDTLITGVRVNVDRLLDSSDKKEVLLVITVQLQGNTRNL